MRTTGSRGVQRQELIEKFQRSRGNNQSKFQRNSSFFVWKKINSGLQKVEFFSEILWMQNVKVKYILAGQQINKLIWSCGSNKLNVIVAQKVDHCRCVTIKEASCTGENMHSWHDNHNCRLQHEARDHFFGNAKRGEKINFEFEVHWCLWVASGVPWTVVGFSFFGRSFLLLLVGTTRDVGWMTVMLLKVVNTAIVIPSKQFFCLYKWFFIFPFPKN